MLCCNAVWFRLLRFGVLHAIVCCWVLVRGDVCGCVLLLCVALCCVLLLYVAVWCGVLCHVTHLRVMLHNIMC